MVLAMFNINLYRPLWVVLALGVAGCSGGQDDASSSSSMLSSSTPPSNPVSSSSVSSSPVSSSSVSSSPASTGACNADIGRGQALYNAVGLNCTTCHGAPDGTDKTPGAGANPSIAIFDGPYGAIGAGKPSEGALDVYIEKHMSAYFGTNCTEGNATCGDDLAAYLYDTAGQNWCAQQGSQPSSSVASTSSASSAVPNSPLHYVTVAAINTGGDNADGDGNIAFKADSGFTGGKVSDVSGGVTDIANTKDDILFFTERWGESQYELSLYNGTFDVEFGFIELVDAHTEGSRVFNVAIEGDIKLSNVDIVKAAGKTRAALVRRVKNVKITDGKLNIDFKAVTHNPTVSYIKVQRIEWPGEQYDRLCTSCHGGPNGEKRTELGDALVASRCTVCGDQKVLENYIGGTMPFKFPQACTGSCATRIADYIHRKFAGYGDNPPVTLPDFLDKGGDTNTCGAPNTEFNHLRRVASADYNRMVADLFKVQGNFTKGFSADQLVGNFFINTTRSAEAGQVEQYFAVAATVADEALKTLANWMPCTDKTYACAKQGLETVGRRAFRRPLTDAETNRFMASFTKVRQGAENLTIGFDRGIAVLVQSLLTAPQFLYYVETGEGSGQVVPLTQYELAARLALFLWRSLPDDALLDLAKQGKLKTNEQIQAQATRMLNDARAKGAVILFHQEWMKVKNPDAGTNGYSQQVAAMVDFNRTVNALTFADKASYKALFEVDYGFLNVHTKTLYNVQGNAIAAGTNGYDKYALNPNRRAGLLARAPFLRSNDSPTVRGIFLREHVLCGVIPAPPPNAAEAIPEADDTLNPRDLFALHTTDPGCGGCHVLMDPLGFPFDHYDDEGHWRDRYPGTTAVPNGFDIDISGNFLLTDVDGDFEGAKELQDKLASSNDVSQCYNYHWFEFAVGRKASTKDTCSLGKVNELASAEGGSILDVMTSIVLSDSFRHRRTAP